MKSKFFLSHFVLILWGCFIAQPGFSLESTTSDLRINSFQTNSSNFSLNNFTPHKYNGVDFISKNSIEWISYRQGVIEFIVDSKNVESQKFAQTYMDSCFAIARLALNELNKSLSYKMNDQIRLFILSDSQQNLQSFSSIDNPLTFNIQLSWEIQNMRQQIRFGIAKHYLQEYLGGLIFREKLSPSAIKPPSWLISGFCNYFSKAITFDEFERFSYLARKGEFNNINFIDIRYQELFGTVVWYLFEKEKGRSINGAFWLLLKNANSFERTFYYHFEKRFSQWLKIRILEIESMGFKDGLKSDSQIPVKHSNIDHLQLDVKESKLLIYEDFRRNPKIKPVNLSTENMEKVALDSVTTLPLHLKELLAIKLKINRFNSTIQVINRINPSQLFVVIKSQFTSNDSLFVLGLILDLHALNFSKNRIIGDPKNSINTIHSGLNSNSNLIGGANLNGDSDFIINKCDTLFRHAVLKESIDYGNFISESAQHFSIIRKTGNHSEVVHFLLDNSKQKWNHFATGTKGYFYHQVESGNKDNFIEFYLLEDQIHLNILTKNSDLLISDSVKKITYSFDTIRLDTSVFGSTKKWDSKKLFVSPFEFNKNSKSIPRKNKDPLKTQQVFKIEPLRNWQYTASSNYYFSNRELDLAYSSIVPVERMYNAPITLFYEGLFPRLLKNSELGILAFSNINRRRIGFEIKHKTDLGWGELNQQFKYRLRQFSINNTNIFRNRSLRYDISISRFILNGNEFHRGIQMNLILKSHLDQIIPLNMNENSINLKISNTQLHSINIGFDDKIRYQLYGFNGYLKYLLNWENGWYNKDMNLGLTSAVDGKLHFTQNYKMFTWETGVKARYSLSKINTFYWINGNNGWIETNQFVSNSGYNSSFISPYLLQQIGGNVRGIQSASRGGNSYFNVQSEISVPVSSLIPSYSINGPLLKSLRFFIWGDAALAFIDGSPWHYNNPYNTLIYSTPNYKLTATANRNPWICGRGIGLKFKLLEMDFRIEYGHGKIGNDAFKRQISISLGNIF